MHFQQESLLDQLNYKKSILEISDIAKVLRGEIAAVESYKDSLASFREDPTSSERLEKILAEHSEAVRYWKNYMASNGIFAETETGIWGQVVYSAIHAANTLGHQPTLSTLEFGEEHGLQEYEDLLDNKILTKDSRDVIQEVLIPRQRRHIKILRSLKEHA